MLPRWQGKCWPELCNQIDCSLVPVLALHLALQHFLIRFFDWDHEEEEPADKQDVEVGPIPICQHVSMTT
jgi:hypothetical protein